MKRDRRRRERERERALKTERERWRERERERERREEREKGEEVILSREITSSSLRELLSTLSSPSHRLTMKVCCPVCSYPLESWTEEGRQRHVNECLDKAAAEAIEKENENQGIARSKPDAPVQPPTRMQVDADNNNNTRKEEEGVSTSYSCPICSKDLSSLSLTNRKAHVSCCLLAIETQASDEGKKKQKKKQQQPPTLSSSSSSPRDMKSENYRCRLCQKDLSSSTYEQRVAHVKKCSKNSAPASSIRGHQSHRQQQQQLSERGDNTEHLVGRSLRDDTSGGIGIGAWLQQIGLEKYAEAFVREEISIDLVGSLTDSDLMTLGVNSLGARKKILTSCCALPIPSSALSGEFAALSSRNSKQKQVKNNRRITQYYNNNNNNNNNENTSGNSASKSKKPRLDYGTQAREKKDEGGSRSRNAPARQQPLVEIGNSNLAICGDKKTLKSLWNYAGE